MIPFPDFALVPGTDVAVYDLYGVVAERGSEGPHVLEIQQLLAQQGLDVPLTGVFDQKTELAVRAFEEIKGMRETGKVSNAMLRILKEQAIIPLPQEIVPSLRTTPAPTQATGWTTGKKVFLGLVALLLLSSGGGTA